MHRLGSAVSWSHHQPTETPWATDAAALTLSIRVNSLRATDALLGWQDDQSAWVTQLAVVSSPSGHCLVLSLTLDSRRAPLQLDAPLDAIGRDQPHEITLRHLGYRLELLIDGVLVDEEWPADLRLLLPGAINVPGDAVTQVELWNRALQDDEVRELCGSLVAMPERYLGPERTIAQGWRPRGFNVNVGDCMPYWHEGRWHLFYLRDRRHHGSMWGCGGHQWAHASTTDLRHWDEHPLAVPIGPESHGSNCTGSVFWHAGVHHAFYTVRQFDGSPAPLCLSTSRNGIDFTPHGPLLTLREPYDGPSGRDPVVFRHDDQFHLLLTTSLNSAPGAPGCLARLVSDDLHHWEQCEPFFIPGPDYPGQPECPDYFAWNGWYYLFFSIEGVAHYRTPRQPLGPWQSPDTDTLDDPMARVMKTAAFGPHRRLGVAFVRDGEQWGGSLRLRELVQHPDGTLTTTWPAELPPNP